MLIIYTKKNISSTRHKLCILYFSRAENNTWITVDRLNNLNLSLFTTRHKNTFYILPRQNATATDFYKLSENNWIHKKKKKNTTSKRTNLSIFRPELNFFLCYILTVEALNS